MRPLLPAAAALLVGALLPGALLLGAAPAGAADPEARPVPADNALPTSGPALLRPDLTASLRCRGDVAGSPLTPVLLLHGTGSNARESWGPVYLPQLEALGRPVCTVDLPERATTDMQVSSEVVVAAVREVAAQRRGRIDVVGHSQGATLAVTALKFWPDLPGLVEDYVGLAPTFTVGTSGEVFCQRPCSAPFQQRRERSVYFAGVRAHPLPPGPSYTTIATRYDEIAAPAPQASRLDGAQNVVLQDRCPTKVVEHFGLITDGTVFALVLDGLTQPGTVDPARIPTTACLDTFPPGTDPVATAPLIAEAIANDVAANGASEKLTEEPPVRCYVGADCADIDDRGRLLRGATVVGDQLRVDVQAPGALRVRALRADGTSAGELSSPLTVGKADLPLPAAAAGAARLELATTTDYYRVAGVETVLPLAAAPAPGSTTTTPGGSLAATGATPVGAVGLLLLATAGLWRRAVGAQSG